MVGTRLPTSIVHTMSQTFPVWDMCDMCLDAMPIGMGRAPSEASRSWPTQLRTKEKHMKQLLKSLVNDESGQDLIEYALLAGFISLVAVLAITQVGSGVNTVYGGLNTQVGLIPTP